MVAALPQLLRLRLEQTLGQWRHWDCQPALERPPELLRRLAAGHSNHSFLVASTELFVVRLDGVNPAANALNRQAEWKALHCAHAAGIAPRPRYFNPELGALVCDYLPADADQDANMADLAGLLRSIHQLAPLHYRLDLRERISRYQHQCQHRGNSHRELLQFQPAIAVVVAAVEADDQPQVLCHNDLLQANRLCSGGRLWALDWEYCAMGSPWFDIAAICCGDELDSGAVMQLCEAYLNRAPLPPELQLLRSYSCLYRYLELLWYHSNEAPGMDRPDRKLAALATALGELAG